MQRDMRNGCVHAYINGDEVTDMIQMLNPTSASYLMQMFASKMILNQAAPNDDEGIMVGDSGSLGDDCA